MSKAEDRSKEIMQASLDYANNLDDIKPTDEFRRNLCIALGQAFMKGAEWADEHQAEKDLELTWEDIKTIKFIFADMMVEVINTEHGWSSQEEFCKEVLRRFYEQRNEDKNVGTLNI